MPRLTRLFLVPFASLLLVSVAVADAKLPAIFADNMVLQREKKVPVWGTAAPDEEVTVSFLGQKVSSKADAKGKWRVDLSPLSAGGPHEMTVSGSNKITFKNVLVGEVWICSGQSNMEWHVEWCKNPKEEIANANDPELRLVIVKKTAAGTQQADFTPDLKWSACTPQTIPTFSATAYSFGRELRKRLKVPVGLIEDCWGGTLCEAWTSEEALKADPDYAKIIERRKNAVEKLSELREKYKTAMKDWEALAAKAKELKLNPPPKPTGPANPNSVDQPNFASNLYNGMLSPVIPYAIRGAIWYQGESNVDRAYQYRKLFPAMIADWRKQWGQGDFPFYFVQLANYLASNQREYLRAQDYPGESDWAELREAQLMTLKASPNTGIAVIFDVGEAADIHPKNKQEVGRRLALNALAKDYGQAVEFSGPEYDSMAVEGNSIRLKFRHTGGKGETAKVISGLNSPLKGFTVCGKDHKFYWADAKIDGESVIVSAPEVTEPVAVRYGWSDNPTATLFNAAGLPASPFRTDDFKGVTVDKK